MATDGSGDLDQGFAAYNKGEFEIALGCFTRVLEVRNRPRFDSGCQPSRRKGARGAERSGAPGRGAYPRQPWRRLRQVAPMDDYSGHVRAHCTCQQSLESTSNAAQSTNDSLLLTTGIYSEGHLHCKICTPMTWCISTWRPSSASCVTVVSLHIRCKVS